MLVPFASSGDIRLGLDTLDEDGDGFVDKIEFMCAARDALNDDGEMNRAQRRSTFKYLELLYEVGDVDGDGVLNKPEVHFVEYLSQAAHNADQEKVNLFNAQDRLGLYRAEEVHRRTDIDGDGMVDLAEFSAVARRDLSNRGWDEESIEATAKDKIAAIFHKADITGDGALDVRELQFSGFMLFGIAAAELDQAMLGEFDRNGDGCIARGEVLDSIERAGPKPADTPRTIRELIRDDFDVVDANRDGRLDEQERRMMVARILNGNLAQ